MTCHVCEVACLVCDNRGPSSHLGCDVSSDIVFFLLWSPNFLFSHVRRGSLTSVAQSKIQAKLESSCMPALLYLSSIRSGLGPGTKLRSMGPGGCVGVQDVSTQDGMLVVTDMFQGEAIQASHGHPREVKRRRLADRV